MRQYEMTYLISDKVSDNEMNAATGKINGLINDHGGKILREESWGRRKLAYPIGKQEFASYVTLNFELKPEELNKLNRELKLSSNVLRYLVLVKDYGKEELKLSAEEVAETSEIEEVVGGERSFEAVEGETEESYDLMAKRDENEEADEEAKEADSQAEGEKQEEKADEEKPTVKDEEQAASKAKEEKPKATAKKTVKKVEKKEEKLEEAKAETKEVEKEKAEEKKPVEKKKAAKKPAAKKDKSDSEGNKKAEEEADRLAKLDEEIEGILGDDL